MGDFGLLFLFVLLVVSFSSPRDADNLSLRVENVCISRRGTLFYCTSFWNLHTPRDREGSFTPEIIKKRQTILAEGLSDKIISLYATGQSMSDISKFLEENYGTKISKETISNITDKVWPEIKAWRTRSLEEVYPIVWMDAIHYKAHDDTGATIARAIYNVIGVDKEGHKDLLGMYVTHSEGANFRLSVLTDLQDRGVKDILIACVDGLTGFPDAIQSVFPKNDVQLCIVHQISQQTDCFVKTYK